MVVSSLERDTALVRDGKVSVHIRGMTDLDSYSRQRLKKRMSNGAAETVTPVNTFLQDIRPGIGVVSRNAEQKILETATEHSYRKTEAIVEKKLGKETIRRDVLKKGEKAKSLPAVRTAERVIPEKRLKDAGDQSQTYKKSAGSSIRQQIGKLLRLQRVYLLIDGVQVFQKEKGKNGEESRECKVGAIVRQQSETMTEMAAWCTWGRIKAFRAMTAAALAIGAVLAGIPIVIVSDGAKWIRHMRKWIPGLAHAIWILDWFHLKDHLLKCLSAFNIEEPSEIAQALIGLLWRGNAEGVKRLE